MAPSPRVELQIDNAATVDIQILPAALPADAVPGDLVAIRPVLAPGSKGKGRDRPLLYKVEKPTEIDDSNASSAVGGSSGAEAFAGLSAARRRGKAQVTVSPTLAQSYSWVKSRTEVELDLIPAPPPVAMCATHVELYFNNMYLSRPDSFALTLSLADKVLHSGQRVALPGSGARLRVGDMYTSLSPTRASSSRAAGGSSSRRRGSTSHAQNVRVDAAYITDETKFVFRSESARCYIFVEMSQEMWHFEEDGSMLLEKCELFLQELFLHYSGKMSPDAEDKRSKGLPTSHVVSIILYGRVIYDDEQDAEEERAPLSRLEDGTLYRDFYKVILDLTPSPPRSIIHEVALELRRWQSTVYLRTRPDGSQRLSGRLANAHESPVLEAMNLALNSFEEHWIDRDLQRTNLEILILTAGTSYYHVEKNLLRLTTERMLYHGIGQDLISLSKMPLHTVPLFQFRSPDPAAAETTMAANDSGISTIPRSTTGVSMGRSPATMGPRLGMSNATSHAFQPSSLRQAASFPASPPLRDPFAPDAASATASQAPSRLAPIQVPDDQRDPLYFDPPPAPHSNAIQHARMASASIGLPSPSLNSIASAPVPSTIASIAPAPAPASGLETSLYYMEPGFVFPHFFGTQIDKPHRVDRFMPRARCYELATQGVTERMPISIPLLKLGPNVVADSIAFLSETEKRQLKRDRHDALAVGAPDPAQLNADGGRAQWAEVRESGATTGTSGTSSSGHGDSAWSVKEDRDAEARAAHEERRHGRPALSALETASASSSRAALGHGQPSTTILSPQSSTSSKTDELDISGSSAQTSDSSELSRSESADDEAEDGRGRLSAREARRKRVHDEASVGRSKTPVARRGSQHRQARSSSVAASVRTVSSAVNKTNATASPSLAARKASTPALIARLTGIAGPVATTSSASPPVPTPAAPAANRPTWRNLFGRAYAPTTTTSPLAAPVALARVDVQASLKPEDSDQDDDATSETPVLGYSSAAHRSSSRKGTAAQEGSLSSVNGRTQPIAIGSSMSNAGSTRAGGQDKAQAVSVDSNANVGSLDKHAGRMSSSLKAYEPGAAFRRAMGISGGKISVASKFNPSKPGKRSIGLADQTRRWASIVITERKSMRMGVKWRSITRGACLPITTDYLPSAEALQSQYSEYRYSVPTSSVTASFLLRTDHPKRSHVLTLITELICQRLSQGFQICTPANAVGALDALNMATSKTLPDVLRDIQDGEVTAIYLSLANQIHRIAYDRRSQTVFVKVLRRRRTWAKTDYGYKALVWTRGRDNYDMSSFTCPYPAMIEPFEWQHYDRLIAGAEQPDVQQSIRYRRTRLVLLPANKIPDRSYIISANKALQGPDVSDAMIQAQGFYALIDLVENARWAPAGLEKEPLTFAQTTLDAPHWANSVAQQQQRPQGDASSSPSLPPISRTPRATWLSRMQGHPAHSFAGRVPSLPTSPRLDLDLDLPAAPLPPSAKTAAAMLARTDTTASVPLLPSSNKSGVSSTHTPASVASLPSSRRPVVQMTHAVVLDLDPAKRSDRSERVLCHLDRSHNVAAAYHIELAWLTASGKVVDNAIQSWTRQTARYGLTLVEVSMRAVLDRHNPFQKPTVIKPVVLPAVPDLSEDSSSDEEASGISVEDKEAVGTYLQELALARVLRSLDFFLDLGADATFPSDIDVQYSYRRTPTLHSQYIHRNGTILVSIFPDDDDAGQLAFACSPNRIWTSHHPEIDSETPMRQLREVCANADELKRLYGELGGSSSVA